MKLILFVVFWLMINCKANLDETKKDKASGSDVVEVAIEAIQKSCIFEDDNLFMRRMAFVESQDGTAVKTFRSDFYGGIWQVEKSDFELTKTINVATLNLIKSEYGIDWPTISWQQLLKPLYSALAARILILYKTQINDILIPFSIEKQAKFWESFITSPGGLQSSFLSQANSYKKIDCKLDADVVFLLDGSKSIKADNFEKVKEFLKKSIKSLNVGFESSRVAIAVFGSYVSEQFDLNTYTSLEQYIQYIDNNVVQPYGDTNMELGLDFIRQNLFSPSKGDRPDHPNIVLILTDGEFSNPELTKQSSVDLLATNVTVFSVGIDEKINRENLKSLSSQPACNPLVVLKEVDKFDELVSLVKRRLCRVPTKVIDNLYVNMKRKDVKHFIYQLHSTCHILQIRTTNIFSEAQVYFAKKYQPNPAKYGCMLKVVVGKDAMVFSADKKSLIYITVVVSKDSIISFKLLPDCTCPNKFEAKPLDTVFMQCTKVVKAYGYNCGPSNPCSPSVIVPGKYHYPHTNRFKFVQCSQWGQCYEMPCGPGTKWDDKNRICGHI